MGAMYRRSCRYFKGKDAMDHKYQDHLMINVDKLLNEMMFQDEKRTCGTAACLYFLFTMLYIVVLTLQFNTLDGHQVTVGMTSFVENIDGWEVSQLHGQQPTRRCA